MDIAGSRMVVTGAGRGIGRAIAVRMAADGARLVVNDADPGAAEDVAAEVGGRAVPGDAASEDGVGALVEAARDHLGGIDVYFANAGVGTAAGLDAGEDDWSRAFEVNVMSHVRAARLLVPAWTEGGGGRMVVTASAAGLLTMLGDAPYSVTKHAAVAFAEWLSACHGNRGIVVQALCPQGVRTRMLDEAGDLARAVGLDSVITPEQVAEEVRAALDDDRFLILPHPEVGDYYAMRARETDAWLSGMRRLHDRLDLGAS